MRTFLERRGYWFRKESVLPYGIDYQLDIQRLSEAYSVPIEVFFDVGANVGQTSESVIRRFQKANVFAFEPDKITFATLVARVRDSRFKPINLALSDTRGEARFFDYGANATSNSLIADSHFAVRSKNPAVVRTVECDTLDDMCAQLGVDRIDVLKVDAEGHDLAVLNGATRMLTEHRIRFVYIEFNTLAPRLDASGGALLPIGTLLEPLGFRFVASYPEYMITTDELFVASNALFFHQLHQP